MSAIIKRGYGKVWEMEKCSERKGLRVNFNKTKSMHLSFGKKRSVFKMDSCGDCGEWVDCNSIQCNKYQRWILRGCFDVFL